MTVANMCDPAQGHQTNAFKVVKTAGYQQDAAAARTRHLLCHHLTK
jgi:hypothetical protein